MEAPVAVPTHGVAIEVRRLHTGSLPEVVQVMVAVLPSILETTVVDDLDLRIAHVVGTTSLRVVAAVPDVQTIPSVRSIPTLLHLLPEAVPLSQALMALSGA